MITDKIIGLDFITSTWEVAVLENKKPLVTPNHQKGLITPLVVGSTEKGEMIVGKDARDQMLFRPEDTVIEVKRLMGIYANVPDSCIDRVSSLLKAECLGYLSRYFAIKATAFCISPLFARVSAIATIRSAAL